MTSTTLERPASLNSQWFASWFDSPHYHKLYGYRDESEAAGFVDALIRLLVPRPDAELLDLGCGAGRHSRHLASRGFRVTGVDLAANSIAEARKAERTGLRFVRHDMRVPFGTGVYDYVFNVFTSFGYFEEPWEHLQVVSNIAESLRCGRTLVLDYLNVDYAEMHQAPNDSKTIDGVTYRVTRWSDAKHFFKRIEIVENGIEPLEHVEKVAKFRLQDFREMFALVGLVIEDVYGDYRPNGYDAETSPRLILVARRRAAPCLPAFRLREVLANAA
jgi:SAM-dependent methyltransferase